MSTRHVILGLLDIAPMSGYDLSRNFKRSLESLWAASYGQIYPTLHRLAEEGLVRGCTASAGRRGRIVYELTPSGRRTFAEWLAGPVRYPPFRDPFRLWASYLDVLPPEVAQVGIARHSELHRTRLEYFERVSQEIESGEHPLVRSRAARLEPVALSRLKSARALVFRELAAQARFELESAARIRAFAARLNEGVETADGLEP